MAAVEPNFRCNAKAVHVTYRGWIDHETILALFRSKGDVVWYSIVHEAGHGANEAGEEAATPYNHTHVAVGYARKLDIKSARAFDIDGVHPHIQTIKSPKHSLLIFDEYHKKAPIFLVQSDTRPIGIMSEQGIKEAKTLFDACALYGIIPKSVADVDKIRRDVPKEELHVHSFPNTIWTLPLLPIAFGIVYCWGIPGTGKTQWALAQSGVPLYCTAIEDMRSYDDTIHSYIVLDDIDFKDVSRETIIAICNWDEKSTIKCRYTNAKIPKHTRKIIISNLPIAENLLKNCSDSQDQAIKRRIWSSVHVQGRTWQPPPDAALPGIGFFEIPPQLFVQDEQHLEGGNGVDLHPPIELDAHDDVANIDQVINLLNDDDLDFDMDLFDE